MEGEARRPAYGITNEEGCRLPDGVGRTTNGIMDIAMENFSVLIVCDVIRRVYVKSALMLECGGSDSSRCTLFCDSYGESATE